MRSKFLLVFFFIYFFNINLYSNINDILDICICLDTYYDNEIETYDKKTNEFITKKYKTSTEIEYFKHRTKSKNTQKLGSIALSLIESLEQDIGVIIASAPLITVINKYIKMYNKDRYNDYILNHRATIKRLEEKIKQLKKEINFIVKLKDTSDNKKYITKKINNYEDQLKFNHKKIYLYELKLKTFGQRDILENYSIYKTIDNEFSVFVNNKKKLDYFNLNKHLKKIDQKDLESAFSDTQTESINIESIKKIFPANDIINQKKIIYLIGHGLFNSKIAQMSLDQYSNFINYLSKNSCLFLFTNSCFSGGLTTLNLSTKLSSDQSKYYQDLSSDFIIVHGAITDSSSKANFDVNFNDFFNGLNEIFSLNYNQKEQNILTSTTPFKKILINITGKLIQNTPLIKFPGMRQFFKPIDVDNKIQIISYPILLEHELKCVKRNIKSKKEIEQLDEIYRKKRKFTEENNSIKLKEINQELEKLVSKKINIEPNYFEIKDKEAILLYPSIIRKTIKISGPKIPIIISMIPGNAIHIIEELDAEKIQLNDLVKNMFLPLEIKSKKLFIIKNIKCKNFNNSKILHPDDPKLDTDEQNLKINDLFILKENEYDLSLIFPLDKKIIQLSYDRHSKNLIPREQDFNFWKSKFNELKTIENAYIESTGGIENKITFEKYINKIFKK